MAEYMPWVIMVIAVVVSIAGLITALIVIARHAGAMGSKLSGLSLRKPYYLLQVEAGNRGVHKLIRMEPSTGQADEGVVSLDEGPSSDPYLPTSDEVDLDARG